MRSLRFLSVIIVGLAAIFATGVLWSTPPPAAAAGTTGIAAGSFHTCVLTSAGGVKCWGNNSLGQLGNGTTTNSSTPVDTGLSSIIAIAAGQYHTCAVTIVDGVKCWGGNVSGQLGNGTTTNSSTPVDVQGLGLSGTLVTDVALGMAHSCAITIDDNVKCWGQGTGGQLGNGGTTNSTTPVDVCAVGTCSSTLGSVIKLDAGWKHTCALLGGGGVTCWGWNGSGQLGDGQACGTTACSIPVNVCADSSCASSLTGVHAIATGGLNILGFGCAVMSSTGGVKCWGDNRDGQLGDGTTTTRTTPVNVCANAACSSLLSGMTYVTAGGDVFHGHTCAISSAYNNVKCWGDNGAGQLGDGGNCSTQLGQFYCPTPVDTCGKNATTPCSLSDMDVLAGATKVDAGGLHTCVLTDQGATGCWGDNSQGQLGDATTTNRNKPVDPVGLWTEAAGLDLGGSSCAASTSGAVRCWGPGSDGQLGNGGTGNSSIAVDVSGLSSDVTGLSVGDAHACAVVAGAAKCWGDNAYGQLGDNSTTDRTSPVTVSGLSSDVTAISAGGRHTCAVLTSGVVKCWGDNTNGQLGDGTTTQRNTPVQVSGVSSALAVAAGSQHTCAIGSGGTSNVRCWGLGTSGQLGQGQFNSSTTPVSVYYQSLGGDAFSITAGGNHTCAVVTINMAVKCWGLNTSGQLGIASGDTTSRSIPVGVYNMGTSSGSHVLTAGGQHTCSAESGNQVKCWGNNAFAQIGDGTLTNRTIPTTVPNVSNALNVAAGLSHTCIRTTAKGLKCWGKNDLGQLGTGSTSSYEYAPQNVVKYMAKPLPSCGAGGAGWGDSVLLLVPMAGLVLVGGGRWKRRRKL